MRTVRDAGFGTRLSRRKLLKMGSAGVGSVALLRYGLTAQPVAAQTDDDPSSVVSGPVAIGFNAAGMLDGTLIDPAALKHGDSRMASEGVRLKVLGVNASNALADIDWMTLDVVYPGHHEAPFMAWSYRNGPAPQVSAPFTMLVPASDTASLQLLVSYLVAGASEPVQAELQLCCGESDHMAKLAPGLYLITLPNSEQTLPVWDRHQLVTLTGEDGCAVPCLYELDEGELRVASRPHVLLSIS